MTQPDRDGGEKPKTMQEVVKKLLKLFGEDGEHWTKNASARGKSGRAVNAESPHAVSWCFVGGVRKIGLRDQEFYNFWKRFPISNPAFFNDSHTWPEVKAKLLEIANEEL